MSDPTPEKRKRWREYWAWQRLIWKLRLDRQYQGQMPENPVIPDDLLDLTCGAKTRAGTPCKLTALYEGGRCKWHGGLSTGPKTEAGKEQSRINGRKGGRPRKAKPKPCDRKKSTRDKGKVAGVQPATPKKAKPKPIHGEE